MNAKSIYVQEAEMDVQAVLAAAAARKAPKGRIARLISKKGK